MNRFLMSAGVLIVSLTTPAASQSFWNGNELLEICTSKSDDYCGGYIVGVFDSALPVIEEGNSVHGFQFCAPLEVQQGQVRDIVVQWLRNNPGKRHYPAPAVVMLALSDTYPCR